LTDLDGLPPAVGKVQVFSPGRVNRRIVEAYQAEGVYGLQRMSMQREYGIVVWRLAQHIVDVVHRNEVEPLVLPDANGVGPSFMEDS
jgi:hypothetical protein